MAYSRAQRKYLAIARAKKRLEQRLEMIDWELDELAPEVENIAVIEATDNLEIEAGDISEVDNDA